WMIGAVVLSLLPTLVKNGLGGTEEVVTLYLAVFSIGVGLGSALASWLSGGRIVLLPTPVAALAMGLFMVDLGWTTWNAVLPGHPLGVSAFFGAAPGLHLAVDFFGMALAGGTFIVPVFSAVQAWSEPAERARVIAALNVLAAALLDAGTRALPP